MRYIELEQLKRIEINILLKFADYCEKNNLRYYLHAGTLLGAVRHKGFIPWDDDIDVVMPRPDFERFFELTKNQPVSDNLDVDFYRNNDNCICPFIKLTDNRTDGHEHYLRKEFHTGVWIDIFPLDGLPDDENERKRHIKNQRRKTDLLSLCTRPFVFTFDPLRLIKRILIYLFFRNVDYKKVNAKLERQALKYDYDSSNLIGVTAFCIGDRYFAQKEGFEDAVKLPFEGFEFNAPGTYNDFLTRLYGDYMTPPREKDRIRKHEYSAWWKNGSIPDEEQLSDEHC